MFLGDQVCRCLQLLTKAGWKGGGLGAKEQGITAPIAAWHNQGRQGIGSAQRSRPVGQAQAVNLGEMHSL